MIMNSLKKIFLFLAAFTPMYLVLIVKSIIQIETTPGINWSGFYLWFLVVMSVLFIVTLVAGFLFMKRPLSTNEDPIEIVEAKNVTDSHFLGYFSLFVLLALSFDITSPYLLLVLGIVMTMVGIVYIKNNLYYINPLFNLFGYKFFSVKYKKKDGDFIYSLKLFTKRNLEKEIGESIRIENSIYNFSKEVKESKASTKKK